MSDRAKLTKRCKVCGEAYQACVSCEKQRSWLVHTDTADHYYLFAVLMRYRAEKNAQDALCALRRRGFTRSNMGTLLPSVQGMVDEIFASEEADEAAETEDTTENSMPDEDSM